MQILKNFFSPFGIGENTAHRTRAHIRAIGGTFPAQKHRQFSPRAPLVHPPHEIKIPNSKFEISYPLMV